MSPRVNKCTRPIAINPLSNIQRQEQKRSDLDEQIKEYIAEWRKQRAKEEEELKRLKARSFIICATFPISTQYLV